MSTNYAIGAVDRPSLIVDDAVTLVAAAVVVVVVPCRRVDGVEADVACAVEVDEYFPSEFSLLERASQLVRSVP